MAADLTAIRKKVRFLTRSPSPTQITDVQIDEYVNTFVLYDIPEHLRLTTLKKEFTFYTEPNEDRYLSNLVPGDLMYQFNDKIISVHPPFYVDGNKVFYTQSIEEFRNLYPIPSLLETLATADGIVQRFQGNIDNIPVLRRNASFSAGALNIYDDGGGTLSGDTGAVSTFDTETGVYDITFNAVPPVGTLIYAHYVPYQASKPMAILYYNNIFFLQPIPDKAYSVKFEVYFRPTFLLNANDQPELQQWWQYIAYGTAKKILEDKSDLESVALIMPEFEKQECLVLRRTLMQQSNQRAATIFSGTDQYSNRFWNNYYY